MAFNVTSKLEYLIAKYVGDGANAKLLLEKLNNPSISAKYFLVEIEKYAESIDEEDLNLIQEIAFYAV